MPFSQRSAACNSWCLLFFPSSHWVSRCCSSHRPCANHEGFMIGAYSPQSHPEVVCEAFGATVALRNQRNMVKRLTSLSHLLPPGTHESHWLTRLSRWRTLPPADRHKAPGVAELRPFVPLMFSWIWIICISFQMKG